jgi:ferredoxin
MSTTKVWIDQDLCTGDGLCAEICPAIFEMHDDGLAYVKEVDWSDIYEGETTRDPKLKMATGLATVPDDLLAATIESADECPGECIFIEAD